MDHFHLMTVFSAVAEEQGFAAAARRLHMSPPAVTRSIAALEERLSVRLFRRSTRHVRLTEVGARYLQDARRIIAEVALADETARGVNATPRGRLVITAPVLFGRIFITPGIVEYLNRYPETEVSTMFLDRVVNFLEEGMDVSIRIGNLPDSSMHALRVGSVRRVLCASPNYLKEYGTPSTPEDLHGHKLIASMAGNHILDLKFKTAGREKELQFKARLTTNTNDAATQAALSGFGITRLLSYQVAEYVQRGELQLILESSEPDPLPVHILHREDRYAAAKVRSFVDLMAERLRANPALNYK